MTRDNAIEIKIPPITAMASGCSICEPAPQAKANGSMPAIVASAVMTMGRNRRRLGDVQDNAMYWNFVVVTWLPIYGCIYWIPRL